MQEAFDAEIAKLHDGEDKFKYFQVSSSRQTVSLSFWLFEFLNYI